MSNNKKFGKVVALNISQQKGTAKHHVDQMIIDQLGVVGDAHAGIGHRQISFLNIESIDAFSKKLGKKFDFGSFGENITYEGLGYQDVGLLDVIQINEVKLKLTQIGKKCHGDGCAIYHQVGKCIMPQEGFFSQVVYPGKITVGDKIEHYPYIFKILIITLSDRASQGVYEDQAGKIASKMVTQFFTGSYWRWQIEQTILPDDAEKLASYLQEARANKVDLVFTLGGTGVGERDITPEVVNKMCDKLLPRIMENICLKYGAENPKALLSRSVAGVMKKTQIYTLPGSVRAVGEYLTEIFKVVEHVVFMLHGIDKH